MDTPGQFGRDDRDLNLCHKLWFWSNDNGKGHSGTLKARRNQVRVLKDTRDWELALLIAWLQFISPRWLSKSRTVVAGSLCLAPSLFQELLRRIGCEYLGLSISVVPYPTLY